MNPECDDLLKASYYLLNASDRVYREYWLMELNAYKGFDRKLSEEMLAEAAKLLGFDLVKRQPFTPVMSDAVATDIAMGR